MSTFADGVGISVLEGAFEGEGQGFRWPPHLAALARIQGDRLHGSARALEPRETSHRMVGKGGL